jgi:hypothetical protein
MRRLNTCTRYILQTYSALLSIYRAKIESRSVGVVATVATKQRQPPRQSIESIQEIDSSVCVGSRTTPEGVQRNPQNDTMDRRALWVARQSSAPLIFETNLLRTRDRTYFSHLYSSTHPLVYEVPVSEHTITTNLPRYDTILAL